MKEVQKQYESTKKLYEQGLTVAPVDVKRVLDLYDTIETLQQENEQLKADCDRMLDEVQELTKECNRFKERLQISPYGDDKIDELDEALENCKFQYEHLKQENEQLNAQVVQMREVLRKARLRKDDM
jgi:predicted RNase H-like nuclease (RuvC/YqgF family)